MTVILLLIGCIYRSQDELESQQTILLGKSRDVFILYSTLELQVF